MSETVRFGVSIEKDLLEKFDKDIVTKSYSSRSESLRDLIRRSLVTRDWRLGKREVVGTITLVYSHHTRELNGELTRIQHEWCRQILSTLHVHLDKHNCLEVLVVRGRSREIQSIAERLTAAKGVKHGDLTMTTTGTGLE